MISLLLAAALSASHPVKAAEPTTPAPVVAVAASPYFLDDSTMVQVICEKWVGSAFYVGNGMFLTARHVVRDDKGRVVKCFIADRKPITVIGMGSKLPADWAAFRADYTPPFRAILSCKPFREGQNYYAQGFASGNPWVVTQRLIGTADHYVDPKDHNFSGGMFLKGSTTQGQSGGPVSDDDGLVTGIVSAGSEDGASQEIFVSLSDTPFCGKTQ